MFGLNDIDLLNNKLEEIETPAFVLDENILIKKLNIATKIQQETNSNILYAMKPLVNPDVMKTMQSYLQGFSASSLYEAKYARDLVNRDSLVHISTPGYRPDEISELANICDCIVLNSLSQYTRFSEYINKKAKIGLRINPQLSFVKDDRYNPCRKNSKLGVSIDSLSKACINNEFNKNFLQEISGIQFHTNCDSLNYTPIVETIEHLSMHLDNILKKIEWINLGGGYLLEDNLDYAPLYETIKLLQDKYNLKVFFEPGSGLVRAAGFIVATVIDLFDGENEEKIVILDTTVNHMSEVFEYQYRPKIYGNTENGNFKYILFGSTCLSGDMFGSYAFIEPLEIGSKVIFQDMGAYTQVKANMFNGVKLPNVYWLNSQRECLLRKKITYQDYFFNYNF